MNGYTPMQSSTLYVTDGDEIDWAYGHEHIFMYTFEMYPSHSSVSSTARFYPPDEVIGPQTERNKAAILLLIEAAGCPYSLDRHGQGQLRTAVRRLRDRRRLDRQPARHRHGDAAARWQRADPAATVRQAGTVPSGAQALVTGARPARTRLVRRRRRRHDHPLAAGRAPGDGRLADVPLLLRPRLELVVGRLLPGLRRGRRRRPDRW